MDALPEGYPGNDLGRSMGAGDDEDDGDDEGGGDGDDPDLSGDDDEGGAKPPAKGENAYTLADGTSLDLSGLTPKQLVAFINSDVQNRVAEKLRATNPALAIRSDDVEGEDSDLLALFGVKPERKGKIKATPAAKDDDDEGDEDVQAPQARRHSGQRLRAKVAEEFVNDITPESTNALIEHILGEITAALDSKLVGVKADIVRPLAKAGLGKLLNSKDGLLGLLETSQADQDEKRASRQSQNFAVNVLGLKADDKIIAKAAKAFREAAQNPDIKRQYGDAVWTDPEVSSAVWAYIFKQARAPGGGKLSRVALGHSSLESGERMARGSQPGQARRRNGSGMSGL
jgi:hypothetical protein